jgi:hypothetical protein
MKHEVCIGGIEKVIMLPGLWKNQNIGHIPEKNNVKI